MTELRFVGSVSVAVGVALAICAAALAVWIYRAELTHDGRRWLRAVLILLRILAIALAVMMVTGPVLRHHRIVPEKGQVYVVVDESQSMQVRDKQATAAQKLLVARSLGWLPAGSIDARLIDAADAIRDAVHAAGGRGAWTRTSLPQRCQSFAHDLASASELIETFGADVRGDDQPVPSTEDSLSEASRSSSQPAVDSALALDDGIKRFRKELLDPANQLERQVSIEAVDESAAMRQLEKLLAIAASQQRWLESTFDAWIAKSIDLSREPYVSAVKRFDESTRWDRITHVLANSEDGLLSRLSRAHQVDLIGLQPGSVRARWSSAEGRDPATSMDQPASRLATDLSSGLRNLVDARSAKAADSADSMSSRSHAAVVLFSDGRHNSGPSPLETARHFAAQGIPLFVVASGSSRVPPDLALAGVESPPVVYRDDQVTGRLALIDSMPAGKPFTLRIEHGGKTVWEKSLATTSAGPRNLEFSFSIREVVESILATSNNSVKLQSVPVSLQVGIVPIAGETRPDNNATTIHVRAITRRNRLLLVDGRPRWEMRYIRNLFERERRWQVTSVLAGASGGPTKMERGTGDEQFPQDRDRLFQYDLIIVGDVNADVFREDELLWLRDYVVQRGGGMILIDGPRMGLKSVAASSAGELLPVKWLQQNPPELDDRSQWKLTQAGQVLPAFALASEGSDNDEIWRQLPPPHQAASIEALPGTETLVEVRSSSATIPVLVSRKIGAGRILYSGCEETWRWRREVADLYHQRFWMQVAQWMMEEPFAASDDYVSIDVVSVVYQPGESADVRVRLRDEAGRSITSAKADVVLLRDGREVGTMPLESDPGGGGLYRGRSQPLESGAYEVFVRAGGFPDDHFRARTRFQVEPALGKELMELSCDRELLEEMSDASGGRCCREDESSQLVRLLQPINTIRDVQTETALWLSYWWFAPIMAALGFEWLIRKRTGYI